MCAAADPAAIGPVTPRMKQQPLAGAQQPGGRAGWRQRGREAAQQVDEGVRRAEDLVVAGHGTLCPGLVRKRRGLRLAGRGGGSVRTGVTQLREELVQVELKDGEPVQDLFVALFGKGPGRRRDLVDVIVGGIGHAQVG
ncbi:hypothetical protein N7510_000905 [Penicillium lagena]|uniref:uncharacterized protein n=1 Tax=Penicillium lagena TaxID=94218 RepID=UPI00254221E8|nr:uncharacterized protein N7510_000905 [Penicillium lagena]KAJ5624596.1 hypothetical protein N7510_000905 [Penicillium lagena]